MLEPYVMPYHHVSTHAKNKIADTQNHAFLSLKCLDLGSGRKIPAIWHGTGDIPVFYPRTLVLKTGFSLVVCSTKTGFSLALN